MAKNSVARDFSRAQISDATFDLRSSSDSNGVGWQCRSLNAGRVAQKKSGSQQLLKIDRKVMGSCYKGF